jgi:hypothetical protein
MQHEWQGQVYETLRTFGPLDDSPRKREWAEDIKRGQDWMEANCCDLPAQVMRGLPGVAWFGDQRGWNSVIVAVVLRALVAAAAFLPWSGRSSGARGPPDHEVHTARL